MGKSQRWAWVAVFIVALALRIVYTLHTYRRPYFGDEGDYISVAWNLVTGHGYQIGDGAARHVTAARGPAYILFLASTFLIAGKGMLVPLMIQCVIDSISCILVFRICVLVFRRVAVGLLGALAYAVYPPFILHAGLLFTEVLTNSLFLIAVLGYLDSELNNNRSAILWSAVAIGVCSLSKPILAVMPFIYLISVGRKGLCRGYLRNCILQLAVIAAILSPWIVRNAIVFHSFVPGVTQGGFTFWGGVGPGEGGRVIPGWSDPYAPAYARTAVKGMNELQRQSWCYRDGIRVIKAHPSRYAVLLLKKVPRLWFNLMNDAPPSKSSLLLALGNLVAFVLAAFGLKRFKPSAFASRLLIALVVYFTVVHLAFFSIFRYSLPVYAYLLCFSAAGASAILSRLGSSKKARDIA